MIPWDYAVIKNSDAEVAVKLWTRPLRYPILIEKTLTLEKGSQSLQIDETLTNESETELHMIWGRRFAFGMPFLKEGACIETSAKKFRAEQAMPGHRIFKPGTEQDWPIVATFDNQKIDASKVLTATEGKFSDLAYLSKFKENAFYRTATDRMSFTIAWDKAIFKSLWYWQERYATQDAPWWGKTYAVALEPWTNDWKKNPTVENIEKEWLKLEPRQIFGNYYINNLYTLAYESGTYFRYKACSR